MSLLDSVLLSSVMPSSPERAYESYNYEFYQVCVVSHAPASGESATATLTSALPPVKKLLLWRFRRLPAKRRYPCRFASKSAR